MNSDNLLFRSDELAMVSPSQVGAKARELANARSYGFAVPAFVAIPTDVCNLLLGAPELLVRLAAKVCLELNSDSLAVRSCALSEDSNQNSMAGIFKTILNVSKDEIESAIRTVLLDAQGKLGGSLDRFSLIVQEFIEPDYSGVIFTRDPRGRRELVIEIAKGRGENVVDGRMKSHLVRMNWGTEDNSALRNFPVLAAEIELFKTVEREKRWPQDIEWCVRGRQLYFLQVRPITSISAGQYREILWLDELLPKKSFFFFEKNATTEIAPRPPPLSLDLMNRLSREDGPVAKVYVRHGIRYTATNSLRQIGAELFVDREAELQSLLPAAHFNRLTMKPRVRFGAGWFRTIRNVARLSLLASRVNLGHRQRLETLLQAALNRPFEELGFESALDEFERDYEVIFEINLLSGIALRNAEHVLKSESVLLTALLESDGAFVNEGQPFEGPIFSAIDLRGNGLDIADESRFISKTMATRPSAELLKCLKWWSSLSPIRRKILTAPLLRMIEFTRLREVGRWLTVRHIDRLRKVAKADATCTGFNQANNVFGASITEIISKKLDERICLERLEALRPYFTTNFPARLSSVIENLPSRHLGVSGGRARGRLVTREEISTVPGPMILFSDSLTPDLVEHFGRIDGIVTSHGGLLSHLAILAREAGLPVVVGFELSEEFAIGNLIEINGDRGEIKSVSET